LSGEAFPFSPDLSTLQSRHLKDLGESKALLVGINLFENGYPEEGLHILCLLARSGDPPVKEAAERYLWLFLPGAEINPWESVLSHFAGEAPPPWTEGGRLFGRALVETGGFQEFLEAFPPGGGEEGEDLLFYRALGAAGLPDGGAVWLAPYFLAVPAGEGHRRILALLEGGGGLPPDSPWEALVKGVEALLREDGPRALDLLEPLLGRSGENERGLTENLTALNRRAGRWTAGAAALLAAGKARSQGYYFHAAGRLLRWAGDLAGAAEAFEQAGTFSEAGGFEEQRSLWYLGETRIAGDPRRAPAILAELAPRWQDRDYFADTLESVTSACFSRRDWEALEALTETTELYGTGENQSRLAYLLARLSETGLWEGGRDRTALFRRAVEADPSGYYAWLARRGLQRTGHETEAGFGAVLEEPPDAPAPPLGADPVFQYLCQTAQADKALAWLEEGSLSGAAFDSGDYFLLAGLLSKTRILTGLRLLNRLPRRGSYALPEWELLYPRGFQELAELNARTYGLPPALLFGLVREESGFDPAIESHAGAVGLGQIMPSTGRDIVERMGRPSGDLKDPAFNLNLSAWYLRWLMDYLGDPMAALLSYNGGPGRIRAQRETWKDLPPDLALETVTPRETRLYGKKVFLSSLYYGSLYYDTSPEAAIRWFFPGL
jgi:soluble lytic murein transglycosylase-like protein